MSESHPGERFLRWAQHEPTVHVLVAIGSHVRAAGEPGAADAHSDWDFQVITSHPADFDRRDWLAAAGLGPPLAYVARGGRLGSARKVTVLLPDGELDLVVIPLEQFRGLRDQVKLGRHTADAQSLRALTDLALVLQGGYRLLKGYETAAELYRFAATDLRPARLGDIELAELADGFVCDYVSTCRKLARGELVAAQRWLHHQLAETNLRLLHELRQRAGEPSFPDARRIEQVVEEPWRGAVSVEALLEDGSLRAAVEKSAQTCRELMRALVGQRWHWPELPAGLRAQG